MAQIQTNETFADGQLVTGNRMNNIISSASLLSGAIVEQNALSNPVENSNSILIHADGGLKQTTVENLFQSDISIKTELVEGDNIAIRQTAGTITIGSAIVSNAPNTPDVIIQGSGGDVQVNTNGNLDVQAGFKHTSTAHTKIAAGTTAERPASGHEIGSIRYNTTEKYLEAWDGTEWKATGGGGFPFEASGGDIVIEPSKNFALATINNFSLEPNGFARWDIVFSQPHNIQGKGQPVEIKSNTEYEEMDGEHLVTSVINANTVRIQVTPDQVPINLVTSFSAQVRKAGNKKIHIYTTVGPNVFQAGPRDGYVEVLVVGGGAGRTFGRGGGGGGVAHKLRYKILANDEILLNVGHGGVPSQDGGTSTFDNIIAYGGLTWGQSGYDNIENTSRFNVQSFDHHLANTHSAGAGCRGDAISYSSSYPAEKNGQGYMCKITNFEQAYGFGGLGYFYNQALSNQDLGDDAFGNKYILNTQNCGHGGFGTINNVGPSRDGQAGIVVISYSYAN